MGSGALQVSPNLEVLGNRDGQSFLREGRPSRAVWLQRPHPGGHVGQGVGDKSLQTQTRVMVRGEVMAGPIGRP